MTDIDRLLRLPEVVRTVSMIATDIMRLVAAGQFPAPLQIGPRTKAWRSTEVAAWMAQREAAPAKSFAPAPPRLPKGTCVNETALIRQAPEYDGKAMTADRLRTYVVPVEELLHGASGIYFLWRDDSIVYVGQTRTGFLRIASHMASPFMSFDAVGFVRCQSEELDQAERSYIDRFLPEYNADPITMKRRRAARAQTRKTR